LTSIEFEGFVFECGNNTTTITTSAPPSPTATTTRMVEIPSTAEAPTTNPIPDDETNRKLGVGLGIGMIAILAAGVIIYCILKRFSVTECGVKVCGEEYVTEEGEKGDSLI
jgi:hypothetical protein